MPTRIGRYQGMLDSNESSYWSIPRKAISVVSGCLFHLSSLRQYKSSSLLLCNAYNTNRAGWTLGNSTGCSKELLDTTSLEIISIENYMGLLISTICRAIRNFFDLPYWANWLWMIVSYMSRELITSWVEVSNNGFVYCFK